MNNLYIKTKQGLKEIVHVDDAAKKLGIKPATLTAYMAREQVFLKKVRIKNLIFFYREDLEKFMEMKKDKKKRDLPMLELFKL
jgi:phage antirepressor YoqD-like protein